MACFQSFRGGSDCTFQREEQILLHSYEYIKNSDCSKVNGDMILRDFVYASYEGNFRSYDVTKIFLLPSISFSTGSKDGAHGLDRLILNNLAVGSVSPTSTKRSPTSRSFVVF